MLSITQQKLVQRKEERKEGIIEKRIENLESKKELHKENVEESTMAKKAVNANMRHRNTLEKSKDTTKSLLEKQA